MNKCTVSIAIAAFATACTLAMAQGVPDNDTIILTAAQSEQLRAEWATARSKWAAMSTEEKLAVRASAQQKRWAELSMLDMYAENDTVMLTAAEAARLSAERAAARATWGAMSPSERAAMRASARQKKTSELSELEKMAGWSN